ncbi:alpha/beta hydrolase [Streptomyces lonarensis]|uniref:Alpha/beta hydrolase n=1 Tax=Streptomyces lonarensis TaxID=700599 RepID=A0A7X6HYC1_9ACTN|nr:alpha/beta hydrolase [Streptomyces lonarensis]NJQ05441.1 alpha/beta hydrolase [Streptomyces lonarensis]
MSPVEPGAPPTRRRGAVALTAAVVLLAGCSGGTEPGGAVTGAGPARGPVDTAELPSDLTDQEPDWSGCPRPDARQGDDQPAPENLRDGTEWECATLTVPQDYDDPEGDTLSVAMIRARAGGDESDRIGSLLFNFGGPGGSGVVTLPAFSDDYASLHKRYDLVSFDPRGVGDSEGVVCLDDQELDAYFAADTAPDTAAGAEELLTRQADFAAACEDGAGDLLPHLTTADTARDMDLMRHVLGDSRLHYFGVSYGTQLGGVYAHLFPERVGRAVFDAVVDPTQDDEQSALGQARGFQLALRAYVEDCLSEDDCPLTGSPEEAEQQLADLLDGLAEEPMPTRDPERPLTRSLAWSGMAQALYSQDFWPYLSQGLADATDETDPDGSVLLFLGDAMNGRSSGGTYSTLQSSLTAIRCADSDSRYTADDVRDRLDTFEEASPVFGSGMAWALLGCTDWPVTGSEPHPDVSAEGSAEILLVGTTGDPATPYEGTARMREALGEGVAVEVTYEGEGHGAYTSGDRCVKRAVDEYLLDGMVPESGLTCG